MADLSNASNDLFFKLRNRFPKIRLGDENGVTTIDPEAARFFNFRYVDKQSNRDYGEITCSLIDGNSMKVFFDTSITDRMLPEDKDYWYRFLKELRRYAKSHMLNFDVRDITKDVLSRRDYEFLAKNNPEKKKMKESLEESRVLWQRKGKVSEGNLNNVRIHVVHNERMLENPNNRLLKVDRIFLVNESGEKFLLPFKSVSGAKAMANHVSRGGNPYDSNGQIISRAVNEMRNLGRFANATRTRTFEAAEANNVIRAAQTVKENLKRHLNRLSNNSRSFNESLEALAEFLGEQVDDVTEVKAWFTQQTYNENLDNYLASAAGAYKRLRENTINKLDEVSDSVKNKILNPQFKLLLKADAGLDKLMTSRNYTDSKAMAVAILGDIANRLVAPDSDDVANFAALMGDLMSSEGEAFGQKADDKEYTSDKKLAILLAQKYLKELNLIKQKPELESQYRKDINRKPEKIKGKKTESEIFAEEIMGIGEESQGASVEDITDAISHRLMSSGAANKLLKAHGLDKVIDAISNVAYSHEGAQELGTSDISIMVNQVMQQLGMREGAMAESGLQYYTGKKKYGKDGMSALAKAGREGASQEELGKIKDKYMKKEDAVSEGPMTAPVKNNGKEVDINTLEVTIPDTTDYPDFSDAHFVSGQYTDGTPIDDQDLDDLARTHGDLLHVMAHDQLNSMDYNEDVNEADMTRRDLLRKSIMAALGLGVVSSGAGALNDLSRMASGGMGDIVPYMYKAAPHGGVDVVLKRNPSNPIQHFETEQQAMAWIKSKMARTEDAVTEEPNEGNEFSGALAAAKASGKKEFEVDGKTYQVKEGDASEPDHEDEDADDKRFDDKEKTKKTKETPMKNKKIEEMRRLAGLPLMENYIYAQEEENDEHEQKGNEPSADDKAEYDQEGRMGKNRLTTIKDAATELETMLQDNENLPEWVQDKITMAADYIDTVRDYMKSNDVEYTDENVEEAAKPDFLDLDKDGDKKEPMKQAAKQAKNKKEKTEESVKADLRWMQAVAGIVIK
jgi:6-pyruvoyl-tetrahydropterin synthase